MTTFEEIEHLSDVPMSLDVELDRKLMTVREILAFEVGATVKLTRAAGENIGVLIGGVLIGSGEITVIDETAGVRITDFKEEE